MNTTAALNTPTQATSVTLDWLPPDDIIRRLSISDSGSVADPDSGHVYALNAHAVAILKLARQQILMDDLLEGLCSNYVPVPARATRQAEDCYNRLKMFVR